MISVSPAVYSITQLNNYVKKLLDGNEVLSGIFVTGEISNFKAHYSGHLYMTIKDEGAAVKAVMFAGNAARLRFMPENGMKVVVFGTVSLYTKDGSYQLYINDMQPDGAGALSVAYEQLKKKLEDEGCFDDSHKKSLPKFPQKIGVVTSETGAAVRDIINVIGRRYPLAEVIVKPVLVQGDGAAKDIAKAIELFNETKSADVLIVGRGGGSIEDLWAFNEEITARAVYNSEIPVISAVGHETDYTICDFVADLRAPTPSAAAELAVPSLEELYNDLLFKKQTLGALMNGRLAFQRETLLRIEQSDALKNPLLKIKDSKSIIREIKQRQITAQRSLFVCEKNKIETLKTKLNALNPNGVIDRGYAIAFDEKGLPISDIDRIAVGQNLSIKLKNGTVDVTVEEIKRN